MCSYLQGVQPEDHQMSHGFFFWSYTHETALGPGSVTNTVYISAEKIASKKAQLSNNSHLFGHIDCMLDGMQCVSSFKTIYQTRPGGLWTQNVGHCCRPKKTLDVWGIPPPNPGALCGCYVKAPAQTQACILCRSERTL